MPLEICATPCTLVETTTSLSFEGGWVGHLAPNAFLQSDLLRCASLGFFVGKRGGWGDGGMVGQQDLPCFCGWSTRAIRG